MKEVARAAAGELAPIRCKNCDAALLGRYCVNCSQAADVHVPTTKELAHELLEGLTHSDSRLWRTLTTLWFKPGKLTEEFVTGRRVAYLPPFRLYLIVSILFFLLLSLMHTSTALITFDDATKPAGSERNAKPFSSCEDANFVTFTGDPKWNLRFKHICETIRHDSDGFLHASLATMSKAMFIFLPLIAFLHMLMYWRPRYRYAEQLLFFVHLHAFYFSVAIAMLCIIDADAAWPSVRGVGSLLNTLLGWCIPVYTVLAMRRVFHRSWMGTLFKGAVLFFIYMIVFALTIFGAFLYTALQL